MRTSDGLSETGGAAGADIPAEAAKAFDAQARAARQRGIAFDFTLAEWWRWWSADDRWSRRGRGRDRLVMARRGDAGPYATDNVYCCTFSENLKHVDPERRRAA